MKKAVLFLTLVLMVNIPPHAFGMKASDWGKAPDTKRFYHLSGVFDGWIQHYRVYSLLKQRTKDYQPSQTDALFVKIVNCLFEMGPDQALDTVGKFIDDHPERGHDDVAEMAFDVMRTACPNK